MKKLFLIIASILLSFTVVSAVVKTNEKNLFQAEGHSKKELERIKKSVKSSKVCGIINKDCNYFNNINEINSNSKLDNKTNINNSKCDNAQINSENILYNNTVVEILQDKSYKYYLVRENENAEPKWILAENINIPPDPETNPERLSKEDLEGYVNLMNFESKTNYFIWVDIDRQLCYLFKGEKNNWRLEKTFICATGKNISPTTRGEFETSDKGEWFYSERLNSGAKYFIRFNGSYLFHSVAMDKEKNITDPILGKRRSSGCVRLALEDIKYLYDTIPEKTKVYIN